MHEVGHASNYTRKVEGKEGYEVWNTTKNLGFSKGEPWSKEVDLKRAEYHRLEREKDSK